MQPRQGALNAPFLSLVTKLLVLRHQMRSYRGRQVMPDSENPWSQRGQCDSECFRRGLFHPVLAPGHTQYPTLHTYPNSVIPSMNSSFENSHCVAARNFHAMISTVMLAGSRARSSQNCCIPSIPILFSSWGSSGYRNKCQKIQRLLKEFIYSRRV